MMAGTEDGAVHPGKARSPSEHGEGIARACYLCGGEEHTLVSDRLRYGSSRKVFRCSSCGLVFLHPGMTPDEEREFYEREYGEIFSAEKGTTPAQLFRSRLPDARMYQEWVRKDIGGRDTCLEIGCASGYFLATIRDEVASVAGVETHQLLREYCIENGIPVFNSVDEIGEGAFSRIFLFFVLEHIGDPVGFLAGLKRILSPDGKIFIVVPNVDDALLSLYDIPAFRSFYFTPAHQFYYARSTLGSLFQKAGFTRFMIEPRQRYDLSNHIHWMTSGRPGGAGRFNHVFTPELNDLYAEALKSRFLCDTLFAWIMA
jgi:SAM-dependent methyltransferase